MIFFVRIIFDKIDLDADGIVTETELQNWIRLVQMRYLSSDTDRQWLDHHQTDGSLLTWESYMNRTYGHVIDEGAISYKLH